MYTSMIHTSIIRNDIEALKCLELPLEILNSTKAASKYIKEGVDIQ